MILLAKQCFPTFWKSFDRLNGFHKGKYISLKHRYGLEMRLGYCGLSLAMEKFSTAAKANHAR